MRISDLARRSGVTVPTIKYYLRERLLSPGKLTSATQAQYDQSHLDRLRLIRALLGPGQLTIAQSRMILRIMESPDPDLFSVLGEAQHTITPDTDAPRQPALNLIARAGWDITEDNPAVGQLAAALAALDSAGFRIPDQNLEQYLAGAQRLARSEIENIPTDSAESAVRYTVLGTILVEPLLLALRRLAQQHEATKRFG